PCLPRARGDRRGDRPRIEGLEVSMNRALQRIALACFVLLVSVAAFVAVAAGDRTWPREIVTGNGTFTIYQPQPETFDGNTLKCRAAVSCAASGGKAPIFGVFWFTGRVDTDRDGGTA